MRSGEGDDLLEVVLIVGLGIAATVLAFVMLAGDIGDLPKVGVAFLIGVIAMAVGAYYLLEDDDAEADKEAAAGPDKRL